MTISEFPAFLLIIIAGNAENENMIRSCISCVYVRKYEKIWYMDKNCIDAKAALSYNKKCMYSF